MGGFLAGPFAVQPAPGGPGEHVLPASALYDWYRLGRLPQPTVYHVSWPQDHHWLICWRCGSAVSASDDGQADRAAFEAVAQGCPLGPGLPLPPWPMSMASQLSITMQDVFQRPRWQSRGIVVVENGNVSHLVSFWNLRAAGQEVFPWVETQADLMEEPLTQWLEEVASATPAVPGRLPDLSVWLPRGDTISPRLSALIGTDRFQLMPEPHDLDPARLRAADDQPRSALHGRHRPGRGSGHFPPGPRLPAAAGILD